MKPSEVKQLQDRWRSPAGRESALDAARWLAGNGDLPAVGMHEGRVDLRGLHFPDANRVGEFSVGGLSFHSLSGFPVFTGVSWRGIDLSGAVIRHARFHDATIEDCKFQRADLLDIRLWRSRISDADFADAIMTDAMIGGNEYEHGDSWTRVTFDRADLARSSAKGSKFVSCSFRGSKLRDITFDHADLGDVVFSGLLERVRFEGLGIAGTRTANSMRNVDFSDVVFRGCGFWGYRFEPPIFADDVRVFHDYPRVVKRASELAAASQDPVEREAQEILAYEASFPWSGTCDGVFFPSDLVAIGDQAIAEAMDRLLGRANEEVLAAGPQTPSGGSDPKKSRWPWAAKRAG